MIFGSILKRSALVGTFGLISFNALAHNDLTLVDWGGDLARAHMQAWVLPWEKTNGKRVNLEYYGGGLKEIRDQVNTTNVTWDVLDMEYSDLIVACKEGLLETIDHAALPGASSDFIEGALVNDCGVGAYVWATVYAYDTDAFKGVAPDSIADFFNTKNFPGNRGLRKDPRGTLEWALMAVGVPANEVYPKLSTSEGIEQAFAELDRIKSSIVWWTNGSEPAALLESGTVTMTAAWNGRLFRPIVDDKKPIKIVWHSQIWEIEFLAITRGTRNLENAKDFLKFTTSTQALADVANYIPYGPTRKSSQSSVMAEVRSHLPTENISNTSLRFNSPWWAANIENIRPKFDQWVTPSGGDIYERGARY